MSELKILGSPVKQERNFMQIEEGRMLEWRVTALNEMLVWCLHAIRPGTSVRVGTLSLEIAECCMSPEEHPESGILSEEDLIAVCLAIPHIRDITFSFRSPVSFRYFNRDYPWPMPEYIFGSLADKWLLCDMPLALNRQEICTTANELLPRKWQGRSRTVFLKEDRGVLAFEGEFSYETAHLPQEQQQLLLLLAQFSVFSGVGRLTGHGLGQSRVKYR
ncbi:MAG: CRISPR system precrRNA processing endoribonuclease RAMP protein Cas6 [Selenomonadaceae bacterium]|nr:CRISPR system precrRNA processing endoribonuclease RAMP protein Cas6 [Selenomonadaceae bacterium]